jgi:hypothetical protein
MSNDEENPFTLPFIRAVLFGSRSGHFLNHEKEPARMIKTRVNTGSASLVAVGQLLLVPTRGANAITSTLLPQLTQPRKKHGLCGSLSKIRFYELTAIFRYYGRG